MLKSLTKWLCVCFSKHQSMCICVSNYPPSFFLGYRNIVNGSIELAQVLYCIIISDSAVALMCHPSAVLIFFQGSENTSMICKQWLDACVGASECSIVMQTCQQTRLFSLFFSIQFETLMDTIRRKSMSGINCQIYWNVNLTYYVELPNYCKRHSQAEAVRRT